MPNSGYGEPGRSKRRALEIQDSPARPKIRLTGQPFLDKELSNGARSVRMVDNSDMIARLVLSGWRVIRSGHSILSGIIHLSSQIFFLFPLTLTLRDPRECKVAERTNVISAEKKRWLIQSSR